MIYLLKVKWFLDEFRDIHFEMSENMLVEYEKTASFSLRFLLNYFFYIFLLIKI